MQVPPDEFRMPFFKERNYVRKFCPFFTHPSEVV